MQVSITARPNAVAALGRLGDVLDEIGHRVIACSGGIDSLVLAHVAHQAHPAGTVVAHTVTPAVPSAGTERVRAGASANGWDLHIVHSREFDDEAYLSNPTDRCFHCKNNLYTAIDALRRELVMAVDTSIMSGANLDDLGEYRPGLAAAEQHGVRHPYVEAEITKREIRAIARHLGLEHAELPASPCLASRLYTGTRVTPTRLRAIEAGEAVLRDTVGLDVVRCRLRDDAVFIEVPDEDRPRIDAEALATVSAAMVAVEPTIRSVTLDTEAYRPGRAFVGAVGTGWNQPGT